MDRLRAQPADADAPAPCSAGGPRVPAQRSRARPGRTSTPSSAPRITACRPTTSSSIPDADDRASHLADQHRDGPARDARGARPRLHRHRRSSSRRIDATLTTVERLERFEGHLLNWYDTQTLAPLPPAYVSTVDSGNLAGALLTLSVGLRDIAPAARGARRRRSFDAMNFRFLSTRSGSCSPSATGSPTPTAPGRLDRVVLRPARLGSAAGQLLAIAKGDVPEMHWFHLGRPVTSVRGAPVLLSWSATLFEYLMPLLVMRSYPDTLLDESCRHGGAPPDRLRRRRAACPGASRSRPTTSSIATAPISTRRSACPGSA